MLRSRQLFSIISNKVGNIKYFLLAIAHIINKELSDPIVRVKREVSRSTSEYLFLYLTKFHGNRPTHDEHKEFSDQSIYRFVTELFIQPCASQMKVQNFHPRILLLVCINNTIVVIFSVFIFFLFCTYFCIFLVNVLNLSCI